MKQKRTVDITNEAIGTGRKLGVLQLTATDPSLDGRTITINGKELINFGSCSYLGLEKHSKLREATIDAIQRYGTQFSSSRTYLSAPPYLELESLLGEVFGAPVMVNPSTTLGHLGALPVIISPDDIVVLDQFVHASVRLAAGQLAAEGVKLKMIPHNRLDMLEREILKAKSLEKKVWFLADGVYSMFGGFLNVTKLQLLMKRYKSLHLYIDDAHGMSWKGRNGTGSVWEQLAGHERLYLSVSLNKAFAAAGGALVLPNEEILLKLKSASLTAIFSGPIQPPMLGAGIASAKIHLTSEIQKLQSDLMTKIQAAQSFSEELDLPSITTDLVPIQYIGVSHRDATYELVNRLMKRGFYVNCGTFPAVRSRNSGLRFTIHHHLRVEDIQALLEAIAEELLKVLKTHGISREQLDNAFGLKKNKSKLTTKQIAQDGLNNKEFTLSYLTSIDSLDHEEWDKLLGQRGNFDAKTLVRIEEAFTNEADLINNWKFHYFIVRNKDSEPILATFFTEALWKTDFIAEASVSESIEAKRVEDPLYLTSKVLSMGCLVTEGNHLYLNTDENWKSALTMMLHRLEEMRIKSGAQSIVFRDIDVKQKSLVSFLEGFDFLSLPLPNSWGVDVNWETEEQYLKGLSKSKRSFQKNRVKPFEELWGLQILNKDNITEPLMSRVYQLYKNTQQRQLTINSFQLPICFFQSIIKNEDWEILTLFMKDSSEQFQGFALCQKNGKSYNFLITGMNYDYISHGIYRQTLSRVIKRGQQLGCSSVNLGLGTDFEKNRQGAQLKEIIMLAQSFDQYQNELIELHKINKESYQRPQKAESLST